MATAKARMVEKTRMVEEKYSAKDGIVLELTQDEANMITALIGHHTSGGEHVMSVYRALKSQVSSYSIGVMKADEKMSGMVNVRS